MMIPLNIVRSITINSKSAKHLCFNQCRYNLLLVTGIILQRKSPGASRAAHQLRCERAAAVMDAEIDGAARGCRRDGATARKRCL